jgi:hypothetical protein
MTVPAAALELFFALLIAGGAGYLIVLRILEKRNLL